MNDNSSHHDCPDDRDVASDHQVTQGLTAQEEQQPPRKMPKRARNFSRRLKKGAPDKKDRQRQDQSITPPAPDNNPIINPIRRSIGFTSAAKGSYTIADYKSELRVVCGENKQLKSDLESANKKLSSAERKIAQLLESNKHSLSKVRESKKVSQSLEGELKTAPKKLNEFSEVMDAAIKNALMKADKKSKVTVLSSQIYIINDIDLTCYFVHRICMNVDYLWRGRREHVLSKLSNPSTTRK